MFAKTVGWWTYHPAVAYAGCTVPDVSTRFPGSSYGSGGFLPHLVLPPMVPHYN